MFELALWNGPLSRSNSTHCRQSSHSISFPSSDFFDQLPCLSVFFPPACFIYLLYCSRGTSQSGVGLWPGSSRRSGFVFFGTSFDCVQIMAVCPHGDTPRVILTAPPALFLCIALSSKPPDAPPLFGLRAKFVNRNPRTSRSFFFSSIGADFLLEFYPSRPRLFVISRIGLLVNG